MFTEGKKECCVGQLDGWSPRYLFQELAADINNNLRFRMIRKCGTQGEVMKEGSGRVWLMSSGVR